MKKQFYQKPPLSPIKNNRLDKFLHTWSSCFISILLILSVVVFAIFAWYLQAYFEASSYNQITNSHITAWQAVFIELRVVSCQ